MSGAIDTLQAAGGHDELIDLLSDVRAARGLSCQHLDELIGLTPGHVNKILSPRREKGLSPTIFDALLPALGIRLAAVDDAEAIAQMQGRWEPRDETNVRHRGWRVSARTLARARPVILQEIIETLARELPGSKCA